MPSWRNDQGRKSTDLGALDVDRANNSLPIFEVRRFLP